MKPIQKGTLVGIITIVVYLSVVVLTTLPEFPLNAFFFTFSLHPNNLLFEDKKTCKPIPIPIPNITIEFSCNAALIAASGSNAGVVSRTTERYTTIVIIPTSVAF